MIRSELSSGAAHSASPKPPSKYDKKKLARANNDSDNGEDARREAAIAARADRIREAKKDIQAEPAEAPKLKAKAKAAVKTVAPKVEEPETKDEKDAKPKAKEIKPVDVVSPEGDETPKPKAKAKAKAAGKTAAKPAPVAKPEPTKVEKSRSWADEVEEAAERGE